MKISRLKLFLYLVFLVPCLLGCGDLLLQTVNSLTAYENVVTVDGVRNNASVFAGFSMFLIGTLCVMVMFITGRDLKWLPRIVPKILSIMVVISFIVGWGMTIVTNNEIGERGYIECTSKRELTLRYSSRTYVLPPETCD